MDDWDERRLASFLIWVTWQRRMGKCARQLCGLRGKSSAVRCVMAMAACTCSLRCPLPGRLVVCLYLYVSIQSSRVVRCRYFLQMFCSSRNLAITLLLLFDFLTIFSLLPCRFVATHSLQTYLILHLEMRFDAIA